MDTTVQRRAFKNEKMITCTKLTFTNLNFRYRLRVFYTNTRACIAKGALLNLNSRIGKCWRLLYGQYPSTLIPIRYRLDSIVNDKTKWNAWFFEKKVILSYLFERLTGYFLQQKKNIKLFFYTPPEIFTTHSTPRSLYLTRSNKVTDWLGFSFK